MRFNHSFNRNVNPFLFDRSSSLPYVLSFYTIINTKYILYIIIIGFFFFIQQFVVDVVVVVVFTLNRSFYPTTSAIPPVSVVPDSSSLRDTNSVVTDSEMEKKQKSLS